MKAKKTLLLLFLIQASLIIAYGQTLKENLDKYLQIVNQKKQFSGELLVAKGNEIVFNGSIGLVSRDTKQPIRIGMVYRVASISKSFTAALIAMAKDEGKLAFENNVKSFIPGLSEKFKSITIDQLLCHTSGLPHNEGIKDYWLLKSKQALTDEQILEEINKTDLLFKPGTKMHYSSIGYCVLAMVVEAVYRDRFANVLANKILSPIRMTKTGTGDEFSDKENPLGYHAIKDDSVVIAPYRNYSLLKGAGAMYSTANDLLRWTQSYFKGNLIRAETMATVVREGQIQREVNIAYGYGWYLNSTTPRKFYHGGGTWGYSSWLAYYPDDDVTIVILCNVSTLPMEAIGLDIERMVFDLPFEMPKIKTQVDSKRANNKLYVGNYVSDSGKMNVKIFNDSTDIYMQLSGNPPFQIYPQGDHRYFGKKVEIDVEFDVTSGVVNGLKAERMGQTFRFKKL
jgi:CubicO group peptidase (beta-lactamase class C family)